MVGRHGQMLVTVVCSWQCWVAGRISCAQVGLSIHGRVGSLTRIRVGDVGWVGACGGLGHVVVTARVRAVVNSLVGSRGC